MIVNKKLIAFLLIRCFYLIIVTQFSACNSSKKENRDWEAPDEVNSLNSPIPITADVELQGEKLYNQYCRTCHGETGFGDGAAVEKLIVSIGENIKTI